MLNKVVTLTAVILAIGAIANGVFMVVGPETWYWSVPGVPDRGSFNQHFIRDIGFIYLLIGAAFGYGAFYPQHRFSLWLFPSAWLVCHAAFHIWEVMVGICGPASLIEDFSGVTLPALLSILMVYHSRKLTPEV